MSRWWLCGSVLLLLLTGPVRAEEPDPLLDEWSPDARFDLLPACFPEQTLRTSLTPEERAARQATLAAERADIQAQVGRLNAESRDRRLLRLRTGAFDPRRDPRPLRPWLEALAGEAAVPRGPRRLLVQLVERPDLAWQADLEARGARVLSLLPPNGALLEVPDALARSIPGRPEVRWADDLRPSDKLAPRLAVELEALTADTAPLELGVYGWDGAGPEPLAAVAHDRAAELEEVISLVDGHGSGNARLIVRVAAARARALAAALAADPRVMNLERFELPGVGNDGSVWLLQSGDPTGQGTPLFDHGLTGAGQIYGEADSGLDTDACQFRYSDAADEITFNNNTQPPDADITHPDNKIVAYYLLAGAAAYDDSCGEFHGTHTTGCAVGDNHRALATGDDAGHDSGDGMAPAAQAVFQDAGLHNGSLVGLYYSGTEDLHLQAYASGARVHNNSFGLAGNEIGYDSESRNVDLVSWRERDYLIVYAAGNNGDYGARTLGGTGSTSKNALVVGASMPGWQEGHEDMSSFSSRGPTQDGRIKPDVMAPGIVLSATETDMDDLGTRCAMQSYYSTARKSLSGSQANNQCAVGASYGSRYPVAGTSFASPTAAGMALLARQYCTDGFYPAGRRSDLDGFVPTNALLKGLLINGARNLTGDIMQITQTGTFRSAGAIDPAPSNHQGYGVITLDDTLYFTDDQRKLAILADIANGNDDLPGGFNEVHGNRYAPITDGQTHVYTLEQVRSVEDLVITLQWSDPPAGAYQSPSLVNDLDLEVVSSSGAVYRGNVGMNGGLSLPVSGDTRDTLNNTERVVIEPDAGGTWEVRVIGRSVPGIACFVCDHPTEQQGYALVAAGAFADLAPEPGARVTYGGTVLQGGCDRDGHLERGETAALAVTMLNRGDRLSDEIRASVSLAPGSEVASPLIHVDTETTQSFGTLSAGEQFTKDWQVHLLPDTGSLCGKTATFLVEWASGDDTGRHEVVVQTDWDDSNGGECEDTICLPAPTVTAVAPNSAAPGDEIYAVTVRGENFMEGAVVEFLGGGVIAGETFIESPQELQVFDVVVAADAELGSRDVRVTNLDEQAGTGGALFWVGDAPDDGGGGGGGGCDCAAGQGGGDAPVGWLALLLAVAARRRAG